MSTEPPDLAATPDEALADRLDVRVVAGLTHAEIRYLRKALRALDRGEISTVLVRATAAPEGPTSEVVFRRV